MQRPYPERVNRKLIMCPLPYRIRFVRRLMIPLGELLHEVDCLSQLTESEPGMRSDMAYLAVLESQVAIDPKPDYKGLVALLVARISAIKDQCSTLPTVANRPSRMMIPTAG